MRTCIVSSPLATQSGYGYHAREFITNLIEQKEKEWDIQLLSMPWGTTPFTYEIPMNWQQKVIPLPLKAQPDIWVQITVPNEFQRVGKYNIGVTAGTEGDICPKEWIEKINQMNVTIVPSQFTKKVFEDTAEKHNLVITTELCVVSEYFNENVYNTKNIVTLSELDNIHESFCFLFAGHWLQGQLGEDRKNISGLIHTFLDTFKSKQGSKPALILKTSGATSSIMDRMEIEQKINQIREIFGNDSNLPNIYLLHGELSDTEMNSLYNHKKIKAMVSFTKSEGFGRPLLEFATTGKLIIAPHYSGPADFLLKDHIMALPGGLTEVHPSARNEFLIEGAKWFTPDYGFAKKCLRETHKHYNKFVGLGKKQKEHVNKNFTSAAIKNQYVNIFKIIDEKVELIPSTQKLNLPNMNTPKSTKLPKIKLPQLNKV
jgi:glycosyltransferase involved in cell wall biosynthesis